MADEQTQSLVPVETKTVIFYDDELAAVRVEHDEGSTIYVPVARLCDNLGLSWTGQRERINRDEVLSQVIKTVRVTRVVKKGGRGGGPVDTLCLPLKFLPGWLFGINASRAKEEIREKLIRYKFEAYDALWDAFKQDILPVLDQEAQISAEMTLAEKALTQAEALYNLAKQQVAIERWLVYHDARLEVVEDVAQEAHKRLDKAAEAFRDIQLRVYGPGQHVTEEQAAEVAELVKAVAMDLTERSPDKNHYQSIWGELHRRYRVASYRRLPAAKFGEVIAWLENWLQSIKSADDKETGAVEG